MLHPHEFIKKIAPAAQERYKRTGIYASCTIAQAALESGWGKTVPQDMKTKKYSYNLFGIKGEGPAGYVECPHEEFIKGKKVKQMAKFRCYHNYEESIADNERILMLDRYKPFREAATADEAAHQLYKCGYATDPRYGQKLISIMKQYRLYDYDID
ncbi:glycoside hydrolase family 73 protein [Desulfofalx alkaliphila]|uniref:glycoside hydrolase family 73 protein n=1 Tax=Desulfofalx alkaliphila TaxID=105483 RepID=UPI00068B892D|nr:glucosaminidase domain-containing protein [Desulfofalx alkaliphila]